ncbi:helix-turn-helix transcriptional regulator [Hyphomicrobium sp. DY-1]|jgi:AraC-like DNA-binding protein|uniref:helix-turn-helix transcriptional regulator n=1 Tax=Hyphomicrobium sp. DY-1 TaxID=3075650 RepID=UPI0039C348AD
MKHHLLLYLMTAAAHGTLPAVDPFLRRVLTIIDDWIESEWSQKEAIKREGNALGWTTERAARLKDAALTAQHLANRVDGMSEASFRRALQYRGAPPPGELIRKARIRYAAKLLTHTGLLVNKVAKRSGYKSEKHFTDAFRAEFKMTPSEYRRASISRTTNP